MKTRTPALLPLILAGLPALAAGRDLEVPQAGPTGEIASLAEANEIRVVFSQPMVVLGRIPQPVEAPFFRISPSVAGSLRWSGTKTLIFTPGAALPFATRYTVTVDPSAASVAGERLPRPYAFSFTTPTVRLLRTSWYRRGRRYDAALVILLRFNQPVEPLGISKHLSLQYQPHKWDPPQISPEGMARLRGLDPESVADFQAKVARTAAAAGASDIVPYANTADWDRGAFPPGADLAVLETREVPPTNAWIRVRLGPDARGVQGPETPGKSQEYTIQLEPTFFVDGLRCSAACDPDDYNPLRFRSSLSVPALRRAIKVRDVTDPAKEAPLKPSGRPPSGEGQETGEEQVEPGEDDYDRTSEVTLEDAGYSVRPARTYAVTVGRGLKSLDGQTLGYTWVGLLENWHQHAFTSFGSGHGVWESSGGPQLPFYARNLESVAYWLAAVTPEELMPTVRQLQDKYFDLTPPGPGSPRRLAPVPDAIQSYGLGVSPFLSPRGTGLLWAALQDGQPIRKAHHPDSDQRPKSTLVQVTNLGVSVKDSPQSTLVFVTRLDSGQPVEGAAVSIRDLDNKVVWAGTTDASGVAVAPDTDLRNHEDWRQLRFIVIAEKDGDVAYAASDWNDGVEPWAFHLRFDLDEAKPILRGTVFGDRGVYKLGEEAHLKALLRSDTARGIALLPGGVAEIVLKDSQGQELDKRALPLSEWSSADWTVKLPEEGSLGRYQVTATVAGQSSSVTGTFLVAAYRRPDFRVDANLAGETSLAGGKLKGVVAGRYLFGSPMAKREVRWTYSRSPLDTLPTAVTERFPEERYAFLEEDRGAWRRREEERLRWKSEELDGQGQLALDLDTDLGAGLPYLYTLEGEVTDLSRQTIAGRASFRVDPAPWYIGLKRPPYFADLMTGLDTEVVAVGLDGKAVPGVGVRLTLVQVQWHSVRRAEGRGYYTWETERKEIEAGRWDVATQDTPSSLHVPLGNGGYFVLRATARDAEGRSTTSTTGFYVLGPGYSAWERYDHNRIDLVPEKKTYRPGDVARILVKSPWEKATALLTTEREGVRTRRTFTLTSTQETLTVPIREGDIPNVYVSVLLVKGRTASYTDPSAGARTPDSDDDSDPGKPAFRLGYVELKVEDRSKRLEVTVKSDREEYRPAGKAKIDVSVADRTGHAGPAEVTLWAVDYGVLSLTAYRTPDVVPSVYVAKALQVLNEDSRQKIISRRVVVSKGADEGGGGGEEEGPGTPVRKDFRVLAFWLGSLVTDVQGRATAQVALPESLTTYRVMAVAGDKASRFGWAQQEIRISKPVLLKPAFPRFLALGDAAFFGSVVHSQMQEKGTAIVTMRSLDPAFLELTREGRKTVEIGPRGSAEVRFEVRAKAVGRARIQMSVKLLGEADAFEETLPVEILVSPEVVAAYGQVPPEAKEVVELPAGVVPNVGGLHLELSSTAMVGLGEGARYLVDYPYGCAEQRASSALALMLAADLGDAFRLPDIEPGKLKDVAAVTLAELEAFQCGNGGFTYWKGGCRFTSPYLTSYVLHVYQQGQRLGYPAKPDVLERAYGYLERELAVEAPENEGWWPSYTAWQAFAVKVLAEGGRSIDSHLTRLHGYLDRMPVFGLSHLLDAMVARGESGERPQELERRIKNAILPEGGTAHVEELADPYLLWLWSSNIRSTAIALGSLVRGSAEEGRIPGLVRWLMKARRKGRWGNTQENALAMEALVEYYKKYEKEIPDFTGVVSLGLETLARREFRGRSSVAQTRDLPMRELLGRGGPGERLDLGVGREGTGTLFYVARLKYAVDALMQQGMDRGFGLERRYSLKDTEAGPSVLSYKAGDLVRVTLKLRLSKERRFVAVTDPLPAGFEPVESWFATTAADLAREQQAEEEQRGDWMAWWRKGGFDHVERHDDRVLLFVTRLSEGEHVFSYVARATTAGTFRAAPTHAEEMYEPEVFGRTASDVVEVRP